MRGIMFDSFPVCRTIFNHWIYDNPDYLKIWITMLGRARYSKELKKGIFNSVGYELYYAQFIYGRTQWSKDLKIGEQKLRTCIKKMLADNMILLTRQTKSFTIYEIVNYAKYNHPNYLGTEGLQEDANQQITNRKPTANQRLTTNKEGIKKDKKVKKDINKKTYGEKVHLTEEEHQKLIEKYGEDQTNEMVAILDNWYLTKGKKPNESDYHTMVGKGWVLKRYQEDQQQQAQKEAPKKNIYDDWK